LRNSNNRDCVIIYLENEADVASCTPYATTIAAGRCKSQYPGRLPVVMNATAQFLQTPAGRASTPVPDTVEWQYSLRRDRHRRSYQYFTCHPVALSDRDPEPRLRTQYGARILLVDEGPGLADLGWAILAAEGFHVSAFRNRTRAWRAFALANVRPSVLVTDDLGGALPGLELIRRCKELEPGLKVLWMSHRHPCSLTKSDRLLVDEIHPRPYCAPLLAQAVRRLCGLLTK
jgi:hypothetical protein